MIKVREVLSELGFVENWGVMTDKQPGYLYDFGNLELRAVEGTSKYFKPVILFSGVLADNRSIEQIIFELPLNVESKKQCVALISYYIGSAFRPSNQCQWLKDGRDWRSHLPWIAEQEAYNARPQCTVERDWFRVAAQKLRDIAPGAEEQETVLINFDGEIFKMHICETVLAMPAIGKAWKAQIAVQLSCFNFLPKRIMGPLVSISIWKDCLQIDNRSFPITHL